jgi:hypothetical protein
MAIDPMAGMLGSASFVVTANVEPFERGLAETEKKARDWSRRVKQPLEEVGKGGRSAAMGFLELSRAIEDAQYGFSAIVNNIPQIALGLGLGAGVAGAASIAAVAVAQLVRHFDDLKDSMESGWLGVPADELARIRKNAEEAAEAFDRLAKAPTEAQAAQQKGLARAITEGPTGRVLEGVLAGIANDPTLRASMTDAERRSLEPRGIGVGAPGVIPEARGDRAEIMKRIDAANRKKASELIGAASRGDVSALATLATMARNNPGGFPAGFLSTLETGTPEARAAQAKLEREGDLNAMNQANRSRQLREQEARDQQQRALEAEGKQIARDQAKRWGLRHLREQEKGLEQQIRRAEGQSRSSDVLSTREYVNRTQTAALNQIPQQQLANLKEMNANLKVIKDKIQNVGALR